MMISSCGPLDVVSGFWQIYTALILYLAVAVNGEVADFRGKEG
jgi:hypothetical protein